MGCGPIGILRLLSEKLGPGGEVVGLEREHRFVELAGYEIERRGLQNVRILEADARNSGLETGSFDLVHERLVLVNVPERQALISATNVPPTCRRACGRSSRNQASTAAHI